VKLSTSLQMVLLVLVVWLPAMSIAQSVFDGRWRIDPAQDQPSTEAQVFLLQDGVYHCLSCNPPLEIKADGTDQKIVGEPCYDTVAITVASPSSIVETDRRNGKTVGGSRKFVSPDGNTLTDEWTESCNADENVITGKQILTRINVGPPGAHAISGSWQIAKPAQLSENALVGTFQLDGETFRFSDPTGQSYVAKLDGTETPVKGDLSNTVVSVRRINANTVEQTDKREGKIVQVVRYSVGPDGKTMTITFIDQVRGTTVQSTAHKLGP
jgi:hypothetical protein